MEARRAVLVSNLRATMFAPLSVRHDVRGRGGRGSVRLVRRRKCTRPVAIGGRCRAAGESCCPDTHLGLSGPCGLLRPVALTGFYLRASFRPYRTSVNPDAIKTARTSIVYAADGSVIAEWHGEQDRTVVALGTCRRTCETRWSPSKTVASTSMTASISRALGARSAPTRDRRCRAGRQHHHPAAGQDTVHRSRALTDAKAQGGAVRLRARVQERQGRRA